MSSGKSAYSPLPQSNSDSDGSSEEELHIFQRNKIVNRGIKVNSPKGENENKEPKSNVINYKPLDNDGDVGLTFNKFLSNPDKVSIIKPDNGLEVFSTSRKICFVFSLFLCVFTTVAFIWILPCNVGTCLSVTDLKHYNFTWEKNLPDIEIYGPINLVSDQNQNQNLIFLTKAILSFGESYSETGLRCLKEKDGSLNWEIKLNEETTVVDCKLIDGNADDYNDCLLFNKNFLMAINSLSGEELWDLQKANKEIHNLYFKEFPLVIPDLNKDEVKELLLSCSYDRAGGIFQNKLVIVSGKTGIIINKPLQIQSCTVIQNLMLENGSILTYTCVNSNEKESFQNISLTELYKSVKSEAKEKTNWTRWEILSQHREPPDTVSLNGFSLTVKNLGTCPEECDLFVDIKNELGGLYNKTVYSLRKENAFGMKPVILKTKKEIGFLLKFWKWHQRTERSNSEYFAANKENKKNITKRSKKFQYVLNKSTILDREMLLDSELEFEKRTDGELHKNKFSHEILNSGNLSLLKVTETTMKIVLNNSRPVVSDVTKDEIIQICKKSRACEPNVNQQKYSILVADFDGNGNEKLITYMSKYIHEKENKLSSWRIFSKIRVLNL